MALLILDPLTVSPSQQSKRICPENIIPSETVVKIQKITKTSIQSMTATEIEALTIDQIDHFSTFHHKVLTKDQFRYLTYRQINVMTVSQIKAMTSYPVLRMLTDSQINALSNDKLLALTPESLKCLTRNELLKLLKLPHNEISIDKILEGNRVGCMTDFQKNDVVRALQELDKQCAELDIKYKGKAVEKIALSAKEVSEQKETNQALNKATASTVVLFAKDFFAIMHSVVKIVSFIAMCFFEVTPAFANVLQILGGCFLIGTGLGMVGSGIVKIRSAINSLHSSTPLNKPEDLLNNLEIFKDNNSSAYLTFFVGVLEVLGGILLITVGISVLSGLGGTAFTNPWLILLLMMLPFLGTYSEVIVKTALSGNLTSSLPLTDILKTMKELSEKIKEESKGKSDEEIKVILSNNQEIQDLKAKLAKLLSQFMLAVLAIDKSKSFGDCLKTNLELIEDKRGTAEEVFNLLNEILQNYNAKEGEKLDLTERSYETLAQDAEYVRIRVGEQVSSEVLKSVESMMALLNKLSSSSIDDKDLSPAVEQITKLKSMTRKLNVINALKIIIMPLVLIVFMILQKYAGSSDNKQLINAIDYGILGLGYLFTLYADLKQKWTRSSGVEIADRAK